MKMGSLNNNILNWDNLKDTMNIEIYRQYIQQEIIDKFFDLTYSPIIDNHINDKKFIVDMGSGYCRWSLKLIKKFQNMLISNDIVIYNFDINDILNEYLKEILNIENDMIKIKDEIIKIGYYSIYEKINLRTDKLRFTDNYIYFIYQRDMLSVYDLNQWDHIIGEIYRTLKTNCFAEFVEYDFVINNIKDGYMTNILKDYLNEKLKDINIKIILNKIKKKFNNVDYIIKKLPLYKESIFNNICIDNMILGCSHFMEDILFILKNKYDIILTYNELTDLLISEWEENKCYIKIYFISAKK